MDCCWKLRVAKGQPAQSMSSQASHDKNVSSEWDHVPQTSGNTFERTETDAVEVEEVHPTEDGGYCTVLV